MIKVAILTVSDSCARGTREDVSGPALIQRCRDLGYEVIVSGIVPDDQKAIAAQLAKWSDELSLTLILTTGGTGIAARDVTPEATRSVINRDVPGLAELIRVKGLEQTRFSVLSRAVVGIRKNSLIVNLPGSPRAATHSLGVIEPLLNHIADLLQGKTEH